MNFSARADRFAVTGGAGFIGSNLAAALVDSGKEVTILDNLSRPKSALNIAWLRNRSGENGLRFIKGDVRDVRSVREAVAGAQVVVHLAAQVAVTTSIEDPVADHGVNVGGSLNVLEAARRSRERPIVIVASTNKVYGALTHLTLREEETRYTSPHLPDGVSETCPLEFCSPY